MRYAYSLGGSSGLKRTYKLGATCVLGQPCIWATASAGTLTDATTTSLADCVGVTTHAGTYSATQADTEGVAEVMIDPFAVFRAKVVPSATENTAYAAGDGYLVTQGTANAAGTTIDDATIGGTTNDANDGEVFCIYGANVGQSRVLVTHTSSTSLVVTVPFDNTIAAGDLFVYSQYSPGVIAVQLTTLLTQLNGTIAGATGGAAVVVGAYVSTVNDGHSVSNPLLEVDFAMADHAFNKA